MFSFFKGTIKDLFINSNSILVVNDLFGIEIHTPYIYNNEEEIQLYIHTNYGSDNSMSFFGFKTIAHMKFFQMLISVPGLGAKTAIKLIVNLDFKGITSSILNKDIKLIVKIPGIGNKIANRIINDLTDKISKEFIDRDENDNTYNLLSALINIGYEKNIILNILPNINKNNSFDEQLRETILLLSKK
jgi:Holliday junction DNA helicase RuvA